MDPLKYSILLAVRDQLETPSWREEQWWEAFRSLFTQPLPSQPDHVYHDSRDDLLFFVVRPPTKQALMVRRKQVALQAELQIGGAKYPSVDWRKTVLLNYVLQTSYELTVVCCGQKHLAKVAQGGLPPSDASTVTKQVFASPMKTEVNLDCSRAEDAAPAMSYPDICFAVDNFDDAFEDTVLAKGEDCYCVVLHALVEAAPPSGLTPGRSISTEAQPCELQEDQAGGRVENEAATPAEGPNARAAPPNPPSTSQPEVRSPLSPTSSTAPPKMSKVMLFAGYVAYHQIVEFMEASRLKLPFGSWFGLPPQQKEKIIMNGPAGLGRCEVAVTRVLLHPAPWQVPGHKENGGMVDKPNGTVDAEDGDVGVVDDTEDADVWADSGVPVDAAPSANSTGDASYVWVNADTRPPPGTPPTPPSAPHTPRTRSRGLFAKMQRSVLEVASNIQKAVVESTAMAPSMQCALMALSLPVDRVCKCLLEPL